MSVFRFVLLVLSVAATASAQTAPRQGRMETVPALETIQSIQLAPEPFRLRTAEAFRISPAPLANGSADSLTNGTLIGAIVGAVALGTVGAVICKAFQEPSDPSCTGDSLRIAAIGAGIGAGVGIAVDAARSQHGGVRVRMSFKF
jgi:hypothetical protein